MKTIFIILIAIAAAVAIFLLGAIATLFLLAHVLGNAIGNFIESWKTR